MKTLNYQRSNDKWELFTPILGVEVKLPTTTGTYEFLEQISNGSDKVSISFLPEPFGHYDDVLYLSKSKKSLGAWYTPKRYKGKVMLYKSLFMFSKFHKKIYIRINKK